MHEPQGMGLLVERDGPIAIATIDRPGVRNALDGPTVEALTAALRRARTGDDVRAMVLTSTGDRSFSAGADLRSLADGTADFASLITALDEELWSPDRVPVVAAVAGDAMGGGFELALLCDLVVAGNHVRFGLPEVGRGLVPSGGATLLPARLPLAVANELVLLGEPITAQRARELGLVNRVAEPGRERATAVELALRLAAAGPLALAATRRLLWSTLLEGPRSGREQIRQRRRTDAEAAEAGEGIRAFLEKRAPSWATASRRQDGWHG